MSLYRDYLGVWPDVGDAALLPPLLPPVPSVCVRTGASLTNREVRWLEWDGCAWVLPLDPPPAPPPEAEIPPSHPFVVWARGVKATWGPQEKRVAAHVLHFGPDTEVARAFLTARCAGITGNWVGEEGKMIDLRLTCSRVVRMDDHPEFGARYRVDLFDEKGDVFVWWTGESCWCDEGVSYTVRAKVKNHGVFQGTRVTTLTRARNVVAKPAAATGDDAGAAAVAAT